MAKRVNNISYKGIRHTPSLVSDADGYASECANLATDGTDLKPMPMPVRSTNGYSVSSGTTLAFVHQGIGYENYIELFDNRGLIFKDKDNNIIYYNGAMMWSNGSKILAIEAVGNTLVVSTENGTEYIIYQPDVPVQGASSGGSYKHIGQAPPMPTIEFRLNHEYELNGTTYGHAYIEDSPTQILDGNGESIRMGSHQTNNVLDAYTLPDQYKDIAIEELSGLIETNMKKAADEGVFVFPFFIRYAYRMRTGDYIMQSPSVLLLPSTDKSPHLCLVQTGTDSGHRILDKYRVITPYSILQYKTVQADTEDWKDIISSVDIFISSPFQNYYSDYRTDEENDGYLNGIESIYHWFYDIHNIDFGECHADGKVIDLVDQVYANSGGYSTACYHLESVEPKIFHKRIEDNTLFYKVASLDLSELTDMPDYKELSVDSLANLTTMPTLTDDYYTHNAVSPSIMQVYNSRLNMANISQKVFGGFANAFQPQSLAGMYDGDSYDIWVEQAYYRVKKNGKAYTATYMSGTTAEKLDYTTHLYYPDPDCYEAVLKIKTRAEGSMSSVLGFITIPMKRHEYLNGSYWYDHMKTLGEYIAENSASVTQTAPQLSTDLWYELPNRFMMSAVGNPWYFPVGNQFDIGRREIRALSINAENMDAPQFGQNPIYVFSADGIWTIAINADGTFNKLSYVSGDVLSEKWTIGSSPTASAQQTTFFKTERGIMAILGSQVKEIGAVMKGRVFNPLTKLLPMNSVLDGIPTTGTESYWLDLINGVCDDIPFVDFAKTSKLLYDYRNDRLLLFPDNKSIPYLYVYDVSHDFWSKMMPIVVDENPSSHSQQEYNTRDGQQSRTTFTAVAMVGSKAVLQDSEGHLWYVGDDRDENDIDTRQFGFYVSRPLRFGTDDMKTLSRIVHDQQLSIATEKIRMALYGSRDGRNFYQVTTLRGTCYKFFIIVLYTHIFPFSRYAYTAFEWESRFSDKIR